MAGYTVRLDAIRAVSEPQRDSIVADLAITGNGTSAQLRPALVQYPNTVQAVGSPGIGAGLRDDVYTILAGYDQRTHFLGDVRTRVIPGVLLALARRRGCRHRRDHRRGLPGPRTPRGANGKVAEVAASAK